MLEMVAVADLVQGLVWNTVMCITGYVWMKWLLMNKKKGGWVLMKRNEAKGID